MTDVRQPRTWRPAVLAITALAVTVRVWAPWRGGLFNDEIFAFYLSRLPIPQLLAVSRMEANTMFSYLIYHPVVTAVHGMEWARWPSLVGAVLAIPIWMAAAREAAGERTAMAVGMLAAVTYCTWIEDTAIRIYGLLTLAMALVFWASVQACKGPIRLHPMVAIAALVLPMLHLLGLAMNVGLLAGLAVIRRLPKGLVAVLSGGLLLGTVQVVYMRSGATNLALHHHPFGSLTQVVAVASYLTGATTFWCWSGRPPVAAEWMLGTVLWLIAAFGAFRLYRSNREVAILTLAGFVACSGAVVTSGLLGIHGFEARYLTPVAALLYLLIACGLPDVPRTVLTTLLCIGNLGVAWLFPTHPYLWNQDWKAVATFVEQRERPGDMLVAYVPYTLVGFNAYYHNGSIPTDFPAPSAISFPIPPGYQGVGEVPLPGPPTDALAADLNGNRVFLVLNQEARDGSAVRAWFASRYRLLDAWHQASINSWGVTDVYLLEPARAAPH